MTSMTDVKVWLQEVKCLPHLCFNNSSTPPVQLISAQIELLILIGVLPCEAGPVLLWLDSQIHNSWYMFLF